MITLVIIGVIAAITVPSLIAKYHEEQLKIQYKKTFSILSQALNKSIMLDFNGNAECYYGQNGLPIANKECNILFDSLTKHLSIQKACNKNAKSNGCVPQYTKFASSDGGCGGYSENSINNEKKIYVLTSGQIIIPYSSIGSQQFLVDINGFKKPNLPGYDVFGFQLYKDSKKGIYLYAADGGCAGSFIASGGKSSANMLKDSYK